MCLTGNPWMNYSVRIEGCEDGDLRLMDGINNSSGRVEFCHDGEWGTVCDDNFGIQEARVACRQLELPTEGAVLFSPMTEFLHCLSHF